MSDTKQCSKCRKLKPLPDFRQAKSNKDGLQNYCRRCHNDANRKWREANREKHLESIRRWHSEHREQSRESNRQWAKDNKQLKRLKDSRRRAAMKDGGVYSILPKEWRKLYSSCCVMCGSARLVAIDHIVPLSRGGRHAIGNLQPLCRSCNSSKKDRLMVEWRRLIARRALLSARVDGN